MIPMQYPPKNCFGEGGLNVSRTSPRRSSMQNLIEIGETVWECMKNKQKITSTHTHTHFFLNTDIRDKKKKFLLHSRFICRSSCYVLEVVVSTIVIFQWCDKFLLGKFRHTQTHTHTIKNHKTHGRTFPIQHSQLSESTWSSQFQFVCKKKIKNVSQVLRNW